MVKGYGQFCPIAKAAEVIGDRWTPLVLRELMYGSERFNDIARGVPLMSRGLLAQRLRELEDAGVVRSTAKENKRGRAYTLTPGGDALRPLIEHMGVWAQRWSKGSVDPADLDDALLIWGTKRRLNHKAVPARRVVLRFDFTGLRRGRTAQRSWWLVLDRGEADVCQKDPGFEVDVTVSADLGAFTHVWLGYAPLQSALRAGTIRFSGPPELVGQVPNWLYLNGELTYRMGIYDLERPETSAQATGLGHHRSDVDRSAERARHGLPASQSATEPEKSLPE
jgi:DNA-binding HxlR family transcriptional regulator